MMPNWTEAQEKAIKLDNTNIIVSAGAGSGKTAVLTERVITKVKNGISINNLLILTFTKAAALEMKGRIRKALEEENCFSDQLALLDSSYITTFDSFALSIVKRYSYILNISSDIKITPNCIIDLKMKKIIDDIFMEKYEKENQDFLKLISSFCVKDDKSIKDEILKLSLKLDQKVYKKKYLEGYLENYFSKDNINKYIDDYSNIIYERLENIKETFLNLLSEIDNKNYDEINDKFIELYKDKDIFNLNNKLNIDFPRKNNNCGENYSKYKSELSSELEIIKQLTKYKNFDEFESEIYKTYDFQKVIIDILIELEDKIEEYKNSNQLFTFYDIAKKAIEIVKNNENIKNELKEEFKEIMVDEYQDTSDIQEELISLIASNNLYMVGDAKQSIYGFRNANLDLFKNKYSTFKNYLSFYNNNDSLRIDLLENFRSRKEVVEGINDIFSIVMDNVIGDVDYQKSHIMIQGNHIYDESPEEFDYNIELINYDNSVKDYTRSEREAFTVLTDIKKKINQKFVIFDKNIKDFRPIKYQDIAILIDRTSDFKTYKKIFEYNNIPLNINQDESLLDGDNIKIIRNIIKFIFLVANKNYNEEYKYTFTSIARSFLFSYSDYKIYNILSENKISQTSIYEIAKKIIKNINTINNVELLDNIINDFDFYEKISLVGNIDKLIAEIDYLRQLFASVNSCEKGLDKLVVFLDDVIENDLKLEYSINIGSNNGVKLMTIHKSKGLEFSVVYCCGLNNKFNESDIKSVFSYDNEIGIISPFYEFGLNDTFLKEIMRYNYRYKEISERIRLFYVALTRAKEKIIFITEDFEDQTDPTLNNKLKINSLRKILQMTYKRFKSTVINVNDELIGISSDYKQIKTMNLHDIFSDEFKKVNVNKEYVNDNLYIKVEKNHYSKTDYKIDDEETIKKKRFGIEVHKILEELDFNHFDEKVLIDCGYSKYTIKIVKDFLKCDLLKNIDKGIIYKEYEFIENEQLGIIDLMIEYNDYIDIIDYKLKNINDVTYYEQIKKYGEYIRKVSKKVVNTYLYSLLNKEIKKIS